MTETRGHPCALPSSRDWPPRRIDMKRSACSAYLMSAMLFCALATDTAYAVSSQVSVPQGGVARWSGTPATECGIYGKRYSAVDSVCYYPIDIKTSVGRHPISLWDHEGKRHSSYVMVERQHFPEV